MKRITVLVLLRRIFGVLNRAVGTLLKPILVLADIRMIGRYLKRDIERHVDSALARRDDQMLEVIHRPKLGMDRLVTPLGAADRPRAPGIVRVRGDLIVASFPKGRSDRMDRREVEHVEAHL